MAQTIKNPLAVQETWVLSMGWEDPLEKEVATHSSILAWEIPLDRETEYSSGVCFSFQSDMRKLANSLTL